MFHTLNSLAHLSVHNTLAALILDNFNVHDDVLSVLLVRANTVERFPPIVFSTDLSSVVQSIDSRGSDSDNEREGKGTATKSRESASIKHQLSTRY